MADQTTRIVLTWEQELGASMVEPACCPDTDQPYSQRQRTGSLACLSPPLSLVCLHISAVTPRVLFSSHTFFLLKILGVFASKIKRKKRVGGLGHHIRS